MCTRIKEAFHNHLDRIAQYSIDNHPLFSLIPEPREPHKQLATQVISTIPQPISPIATPSPEVLIALPYQHKNFPFIKGFQLLGQSKPFDNTDYTLNLNLLDHLPETTIYFTIHHYPSSPPAIISKAFLGADGKLKYITDVKQNHKTIGLMHAVLASNS